MQVYLYGLLLCQNTDSEFSVRSMAEVLKTTEEKKVEVQSTTAHPHLLFFDDITTDTSDWRNKYMAKWYGKKKVVLVERQ